MCCFIPCSQAHIDRPRPTYRFRAPSALLVVGLFLALRTNHTTYISYDILLLFTLCDK